MTAIAKVQTQDKDVNQLQSNIAAALRPVLQNPAASATLLTSISLTAGINNIPHKLGRTVQGWQISRQRAAAAIYDTQDSNKTPDQTLVLVSSAAVTVDLLVF